MIALILANGFEEIEALTPLDMLRRAGVPIEIVGIGGTVIEGAHGIKVIADVADADADITKYDFVILPGGMPGSVNLDASPTADAIIISVAARGGRLAAGSYADAFEGQE